MLPVQSLYFEDHWPSRNGKVQPRSRGSQDRMEYCGNFEGDFLWYFLRSQKKMIPSSSV